MRIGATEILLILVLALVVFGGSKLGGVGKALGQSIREFKKEVKTDDDKTEAAKADDKTEVAKADIKTEEKSENK